MLCKLLPKEEVNKTGTVPAYPPVEFEIHPYVLASVEREERNNESRSEEETFAQEAERKPGRSAGNSRSKSSLRDVSTLKGLVEGVGAAGSSNAGGRASFSVLLERVKK
ncbi:unnamed protein product [Bathycoccus prasinos]